ncbi:MAG: glycosyltransferase family 2 protein [Lachnospiraceae bacterium]|nr:glycosyltransferase family 2 protein [Lachnospiraceae bacterium]MDE6252671.1 glycosyltransferase family 2 protein [Lachnospiraceae bacterium]
MKELKDTILYIVIPCYNEEEVLNITCSELDKKIQSLIDENMISKDSKAVFVDDGSNDSTWSLITEMHEKNARFEGIKLSRNQGHQNALLAGLFYSGERADIVVSIDADLQDDMDAINQMIEKYSMGAEIVYGVRNDRKTDTMFKRGSAQIFYRIMRIMGAEIVYNHADFRLMSSKSIKELMNFKEVNLFLRGIVPLLGFETAVVEYQRKERVAGNSKYPLRKMMSFALDGITSFTIKPIDMIISAGMVCFIISIIMLVYSCIRHFMGETVSGWTSLMTSIWALGGLQVLSIGVVGKYIGKVYMEVKERPRYIIEEYTNPK